MNYYLVKVTEKIVNGFGGTAQGPIIRILPKYKDDIGLLEHEKVHVRQWYAWLALGLLIGTLLTLLVSLSLWSRCPSGLCLAWHRSSTRCCTNWFDRTGAGVRLRPTASNSQPGAMTATTLEWPHWSRSTT